MQKYLTVVILLENGKWLKYRNIVEGKEGNLLRYVSTKIGAFQYANIYDKVTKNYLRRLYC